MKASARFTPGPWVYRPPIGLGLHRGDIVSICKGFPERFVATAAGQEDAAERLANAYLIAAAPDLYSGCSAMLGLVQLILNRDDLSPELRSVLQADNHRIAEAVAALAKADGPSR